MRRTILAAPLLLALLLPAHAAPVRLAGDAEDDLKEYRRRLLAQGREGDVLLLSGKRRAKIVDVDEEYRLIVEYPDGTREALSSGEISVLPDAKRE